MSIRTRVSGAWRALFGVTSPSGPGVVPDWRPSILHHQFSLDPLTWDFPKAYRKVSTIRACVARKTSDLAAQPVVIERESSAGWEPLTRQKGNLVDVWHAGNPRQTGREVIRDLHANFAIHGNAYMVAETFGLRRVTELWVMPSHLVEVVPGPRRMAEAYVFDRGGVKELIPAENVIPWHDFTPDDDPVGVSALEAAQLQYETRYDLMRLFQKVVRSGGRAAGYFRVPQPANGVPVILTDEEKRAIAESLRKMKRSLDLDIVLDVLEFQRMGLTMSEMQFLENASMSDADICRVLGVPPWLIGIKEGAKLGDSGQSASADERIYWMNLKAELEARDALLTERLVPMFREANVRFRTDLSAVAALNQPLLNAAQQAVALAGRPVLTVNEVRRLSGLPPSDDPSADELQEPRSPLDGFGFGGGQAASNDPPADQGKSEDGKPAAKSLRLIDTPERAERWRAKDTIMRRYEAKFERAWLGMLRERRAKLMRALEDAGLRAMEAKRAVDLDALFAPDPDEERKFQALYEALIIERGAEAAAEIALELEINIHAREVQQFIQARKTVGLDGALDTFMESVRASVAEGVGLHEGLSELAARIADKFDDAEQGRVLTIARTEAISAFNFATAEAWRQSGEVEETEWLSARDSAVRDTHAMADGQKAKMGEAFSVGGSALAFPGDPAGPPEETINCRCTLLPVLSERARRSRPLSVYFPSRNGRARKSGRIGVEA